MDVGVTRLCTLIRLIVFAESHDQLSFKRGRGGRAGTQVQFRKFRASAIWWP